MKKKKEHSQKKWFDNLTRQQHAFIDQFEKMGFIRNKKFSFLIPGGGMVKIISSHNSPLYNHIMIGRANYGTEEFSTLLEAVDKIKEMIQNSIDPPVNGRSDRAVYSGGGSYSYKNYPLTYADAFVEKPKQTFFVYGTESKVRPNYTNKIKKNLRQKRI